MRASKLIICILFLGASPLLKSQKGFEFGPSFQLQNTWLLNKTDNDQGGSLDFQGTYNISYGVQMGYGFHARHGIRVGAFVSQQGQNYITSEEFLRLPSAKYYTKTEYLQIPVLYRYNGRLDIANSSFLLTAGPQFGFLQSARSKVLFADSLMNLVEVSPELNSMNAFQSMDVSAHLGLGILARFSPKFHMNATLNINYSLQGIEKENFDLILRKGTRNAIVGVNIGFYILLGGPEMAITGPPKMK
ncbi:MAG: outer membrane beta-barrel protein [Bacteroidia bacterium]